MKSRVQIPLLSAALLAALLVSGCGRIRGKGAQEINYVSAQQAILRDRVAAVYTKTGTVKNGDRVQVLERDRRFARVRAADGSEGWMEQRYLISQQVYDKFQKMAQDEKSTPAQATAATRNDTNIHLDPARDAEHLYELPQGSKISLLKRTTSERAIPSGAPKAADTKKPVVPVMEDWWMVRDSEGHVGWVLARMMDLDVPLEIAQYSEGQRIISFAILNQVQDHDKQVPQYLVLFSEPKDGMPFDFNQARVFTWNVKRHRYETAYRERKLNGVLPVTVTQENFEKEGTLPVFVLRVKNYDGNISERKYMLNTPVVRKVLK